MPFFLNPLFLVGLGATAIPIAVHLINRRNPKPTPFSTLRFLRVAMVKTRRTRHLTQILVLLARMLLLACLALAFARPRLRSGGWLPGGPRTVVMVIDGTMSMQTVVGEATAFDHAKTWSNALLAELSYRDRAAVIFVGLASDASVFPAVSDIKTIVRAIDDAACGYAAVNLTVAMRDALRQVVEHHGRDAIELHVFSDFQANAWSPTEAELLRDDLEAGDVTLFLNQVRSGEPPNAWPATMRVVPEALVGGGQVTVQLTIRTDADFTGPNTLRVIVDGRESASQGLSLGANDERQVSVPVSIGEAQSVVRVAATLDDDALNADNSRFAALTHQDHLKVLLVNGAPAPMATLSDSFYIDVALNPQRLGNPMMRSQTIDWPQLASARLSDYDTVLVCNPPEISAAQALQLELYVKDGGLLVLYPGFRRGLEQSWQRFAPLQGLELRSDALPETRTVRVLQAERPGELERRTTRILGQLPAFACRERLLYSALPAGATVFFSTDVGTPLAAGVAHGSGQLWLSALPADRSWSEWPLSPLFVIFHQELIRQSFGTRRLASVVEVGGSAELNWGGDETSLSLDRQRPDGTMDSVVLQRPNRERPFLLGGFDAPGVFELTVTDKPDESRYVAANVPAMESLLERVAADELVAQLGPAEVYANQSLEQLQSRLTQMTRGVPLWPWLLLMAFFLGIGEELLANERSWRQSMPDTLQRALRRRRA